MPNRIIKESICYSADLDKLTPFEETVFYRLIVNVDDFGRTDARPGYLKSKLFVTKQGITEKNVSDALQKMASIGLVRLYSVDGKSFLLFPKWSSHQQRRANKSKWPTPDDECNQLISDDINGNQLQADAPVFVIEESRIEESRIEDICGADALTRTKKFRPPTEDEVSTYCRERGNCVDAQRFVDHYTSNGWRVGKNPMKDWRAAVRTWEKNDGGNANATSQSAVRAGSDRGAAGTVSPYPGVARV